MEDPYLLTATRAGSGSPCKVNKNKGAELYHRYNAWGVLDPPRKLSDEARRLRNLPFFEKAGAPFLHALNERFKTCRNVPKGSVLFLEGDTEDDAMYVLKKGHVRLISTEDDNEIEVAQDSCFGEFRLFGLTEKRLATAIVVSERATLRVLERELFLRVLQNFPNEVDKIVAVAKGIVLGRKSKFAQGQNASSPQRSRAGGMIFKPHPSWRQHVGDLEDAAFATLLPRSNVAVLASDLRRLQDGPGSDREDVDTHTVRSSTQSSFTYARGTTSERTSVTSTTFRASDFLGSAALTNASHIEQLNNRGPGGGGGGGASSSVSSFHQTQAATPSTIGEAYFNAQAAGSYNSTPTGGQSSSGGNNTGGPISGQPGSGGGGSHSSSSNHMHNSHTSSGPNYMASTGGRSKSKYRHSIKSNAAGVAPLTMNNVNRLLGASNAGASTSGSGSGGAASVTGGGGQTPNKNSANQHGGSNGTSSQHQLFGKTLASLKRNTTALVPSPGGGQTFAGRSPKQQGSHKSSSPGSTSGSPRAGAGKSPSNGTPSSKRMQNNKLELAQLGSNSPTGDKTGQVLSSFGAQQGNANNNKPRGDSGSGTTGTTSSTSATSTTPNNLANIYSNPTKSTAAEGTGASGGGGSANSRGSANDQLSTSTSANAPPSSILNSSSSSSGAINVHVGDSSISSASAAAPAPVEGNLTQTLNLQPRRASVMHLQKRNSISDLGAISETKIVEAQEDDGYLRDMATNRDRRKSRIYTRRATELSLLPETEDESDVASNRGSIVATLGINGFMSTPTPSGQPRFSIHNLGVAVNGGRNSVVLEDRGGVQSSSLGSLGGTSMSLGDSQMLGPANDRGGDGVTGGPRPSMPRASFRLNVPSTLLIPNKKNEKSSSCRGSVVREQFLVPSFPRSCARNSIMGPISALQGYVQGNAQNTNTKKGMGMERLSELQPVGGQCGGQSHSESRVESEQAAASLSAQLRLLMTRTTSGTSGRVYIKDREFNWTALGDAFAKVVPTEYDLRRGRGPWPRVDAEEDEDEDEKVERRLLLCEFMEEIIKPDCNKPKLLNLEKQVALKWQPKLRDVGAEGAMAPGKGEGGGGGAVNTTELNRQRSPNKPQVRKFLSQSSIFEHQLFAPTLLKSIELSPEQLSAHSAQNSPEARRRVKQARRQKVYTTDAGENWLSVL
ncbi:unnamed protein product [Amoebophrya sp. A25]|nr:unnamed protein product [Amoebophrya sp. A25]|eukprot:GSA25T00007484001.1